MEINKKEIPAGTSAVVIAIAESLAKELICSEIPKIIVALEKDIADTNKVIHPFKHEAYVLFLDLMKGVQSLAGCEVKELPSEEGN